MLACQYRDRYIYSTPKVGEDEIQYYFQRTAKAGEKLADAKRTAIGASLRNDKLNYSSPMAARSSPIFACRRCIASMLRCCTSCGTTVITFCPIGVM